MRYQLKTPHVDGTTHVILLRAFCSPALGPIQAGNLINGLRHHARLPEVDLSEDPDDNPLLAMAIAGEVNYHTARRFLSILKK